MAVAMSPYHDTAQWQGSILFLFAFMLHVGSEAPFALIYWPDEERVSIVKTQDIHDYSSVLGDGDTVLVKFGGQTFSGILKEKGIIPEV
jgi:hypothetical protein